MEEARQPKKYEESKEKHKKGESEMYQIIDNQYFFGKVGDVIESDEKFYCGVECTYEEYNECGARLWTIDEAIKEGKIKRI